MSSPKSPDERVKELLLAHRGAGDPITSREINEEIDVDTVGSFPSTRALVRELIEGEQLPIVSDGNGYYVAETEAELASYIESLDSRLVSIADRKAAVIRAAQEWDDRIESDADSDLL
jgi:hypothetical protein